MKHQGLTKFTLLTILALVLGACSGSGSGPNPLQDAGGGGTGGTPEYGGSSGDESSSDAPPLTITVTSPAEGGTLETPDEAVALAGTASGSGEIVAVSWTSDKGEQGTASGSESWETGNIPLQVGDNTITITAEDSTGATASETVIVKRESDEMGSVTLNWEAPTTREDGSPLTDLSGYTIHYGRMSETYDYEIKIENPGVVSYVIEQLSPGTWYFVARAYDSAGLESKISNEVSKDVP